jgi:hypothetical protein
MVVGAGLVVVIANMLIIAALGLFLLVFRQNRFAAPRITFEAGQRVISTGPYVRHPIYTGAALLTFATPLALGSLSGLRVFESPKRECDFGLADDLLFLFELDYGQRINWVPYHAEFHRSSNASMRLMLKRIFFIDHCF